MQLFPGFLFYCVAAFFQCSLCFFSPISLSLFARISTSEVNLLYLSPWWKKRNLLRHLKEMLRHFLIATELK